jgi:hypothetical protein
MVNVSKSSSSEISSCSTGVEVVEPPTPQYDQAELHKLLESGFRGALKKALNQMEPVLDDTLAHVGKILNEKIRSCQDQLKVCALCEELLVWFVMHTTCTT